MTYYETLDYYEMFWYVMSVWYIFYKSLHSVMTCRQSVKELLLLFISHKLLAIYKRSPLPYLLPDIPSLSNLSLIAPRSTPIRILLQFTLQFFILFSV